MTKHTCTCGCGQETSKPGGFVRGHHHYRPIEEQIWQRVRRTETCWIWTGALGRGGYGYVSVKAHTYRVHRLVWELTHTAIPDGMSVCHSCNNPPCCNPDHLYLATRQENSTHAARDGLYTTGDAHTTRRGKQRLYYGDDHWTHRKPERLARGDRNGARTKPERFAVFRLAGTKTAATLDEAKVREIRALWATGEWRQKALSERFGVRVDQISRVVNRRSWAHIE